MRRDARSSHTLSDSRAVRCEREVVASDRRFCIQAGGSTTFRGNSALAERPFVASALTYTVSPMNVSPILKVADQPSPPESSFAVWPPDVQKTTLEIGTPESNMAANSVST